MGIELVLGHFGCGLHDGVLDVGFKIIKLVIGDRGRAFDNAERADDRGRHGLFADRKIDEGAGRLRAEIFVIWHFKRAKAVSFGAGIGHGRAPV